MLDQPRGPAPTIKDVARLAGVSHMTVSRVMSGRTNVAAETRDRVLRAAEELGYQPNILARGLVSRTSGVIGLIASDITNPFIAELARAIHQVADDERYVVTMCVTDHDGDRELRALDQLVQRRVDGLILTPEGPSRADDRIRSLAEGGLPVVAITREVPGACISTVTGDTQEGAYHAGLHLLRLGHRRIAFIDGTPRSGFAPRKRRGLEAALREYGIDAGNDLVFANSDWRVSDGRIAMQALLARDPRPTAVFACTDTVAIGAMGAIEAAGLRTPEDIAVIGFDDIPFASYMHPALTTVRQPIADLGALATRILLDRIRSTIPMEPAHVTLPCELTIRGTTVTTAIAARRA